MPSYYWLYCRLNVPVSMTGAEVAEAFGQYADAHIAGGRASLTDAHYAGIAAEHTDAQNLYREVTRGV